MGRIDNFTLLNHIGYNLSNFSLVSTIRKCFHIDRNLAFNSNLIFSKIYANLFIRKLSQEYNFGSLKGADVLFLEFGLFK